MNLTRDQLIAVAGTSGLVFMGLGFIFWNGWWFLTGVLMFGYSLYDIFFGGPRIEGE